MSHYLRSKKELRNLKIANLKIVKPGNLLDD